MKYGYTIICLFLLSACSISHHTVYLNAWDNETLTDRRKKIYRVKIDLPRAYLFSSIESGGEFGVQYNYSNLSDSSTAFVSNVDPGLEEYSTDYSKLKRREYIDSCRYFVEFKYRHIHYGYRNVSSANKGKMDSLINKVKIDSVYLAMLVCSLKVTIPKWYNFLVT